MARIMAKDPDPSAVVDSSPEPQPWPVSRPLSLRMVVRFVLLVRPGDALISTQGERVANVCHFRGPGSFLLPRCTGSRCKTDAVLATVTGKQTPRLPLDSGLGRRSEAAIRKPGDRP